jgi:hypothetical protein
MNKKQATALFLSLMGGPVSVMWAESVDATAPPDSPRAYEIVNETQVLPWFQTHPDALQFLCNAELLLHMEILDQDLNGVLSPDLPSDDPSLPFSVGMFEIATRYAIDLTGEQFPVLFTPEAVTLLATGEAGTYTLCS